MVLALYGHSGLGTNGPIHATAIHRVVARLLAPVCDRFANLVRRGAYAVGGSIEPSQLSQHEERTEPSAYMRARTSPSATVPAGFQSFPRAFLADVSRSRACSTWFEFQAIYPRRKYPPTARGLVRHARSRRCAAVIGSPLSRAISPSNNSVPVSSGLSASALLTDSSAAASCSPERADAASSSPFRW